MYNKLLWTSLVVYVTTRNTVHTCVYCYLNHFENVLSHYNIKPCSTKAKEYKILNTHKANEFSWEGVHVYSCGISNLKLSNQRNLLHPEY